MIFMEVGASNGNIVAYNKTFLPRYSRKMFYMEDFRDINDEF